MPPGAPATPNPAATASPDELQALLELSAKQDALRAATEANTATLRDVQRLWGHNPGVSHQPFLAPGPGGVYNRGPGSPTYTPPAVAPPKATGPEVSAVQANTRALSLVARGLDAAARAGTFAARLGIGTALAVPVAAARAGAAVAGAGARLGGEAVREATSPDLAAVGAMGFHAVALGNPYAAERFQQAVKDLQAVVGRDLAPALESITGKVRALADAYVALDPKTHALVTTVGEMAAAAIAAGVGVKALTLSLGFLARNPLVVAAMAATPGVMGEITAAADDTAAAADVNRLRAAGLTPEEAAAGEGVFARRDAAAPGRSRTEKVSEATAIYKAAESDARRLQNEINKSYPRALGGNKDFEAGVVQSLNRAGDVVARAGRAVAPAGNWLMEAMGGEAVDLREPRTQASILGELRTAEQAKEAARARLTAVVPDPFRTDLAARQREREAAMSPPQREEYERSRAGWQESLRQARATGKAGPELDAEFNARWNAFRTQAKAAVLQPVPPGQPPAPGVAPVAPPVKAVEARPGGATARAPLPPGVGTGASFGAAGFPHAGIGGIEETYRHFAELALRSPVVPGQAPEKDAAEKTADNTDRMVTELRRLADALEGKGKPPPPNDAGPLNVRFW